MPTGYEGADEALDELMNKRFGKQAIGERPQTYTSGDTFASDPRGLDMLFRKYMLGDFGKEGGGMGYSRGLFGFSQPTSTSAGLGGFTNRSFGGGGSMLSPGGLDLNALLQRSIAGTVAGAQEETGIKRQQVASDLLSQQLAQAAQELQNRMHGYEFGQTQQFDKALAGGDPRLGATLTDIARQGGVNWMTTPSSRLALEAFGQGGKQVTSHHEIAASILKNWQITGQGLGIPEPPEVAWARNVLGISAKSDVAPPNPPVPATTQKVPYGQGRAALGSAVSGGIGAAGAKYLPALASKAIPKIAPFIAKHPAGAGFLAFLAASGLGQAGYERFIDPQLVKAELENPFTTLGASAGGAMGFGRVSKLLGRQFGPIAEEATAQAAGKTRTGEQRLLNPPPAEAMTTTQPPSISPSLGGPNPSDFVKRFRTFYGRNPTVDELQQFTRGFAPTAPQGQLNAPPKGPYKPRVKGYEDFLKKYFGVQEP